MDSSDTSDGPSTTPKYRLSEIVGVMIALMTLTLPLLTITRYSPSQQQLTLPTASVGSVLRVTPQAA